MIIREFSCFSGAGGSRTRVQTCCRDAFYTFSHRLVVGAWQVRDQPTLRLSSELRSRIEACARYPSLYDTSDRTPDGGGLPGKHPVPRTLSGLRNSPRLGSESIVVAIYWLRELVFNGTVSQPPTCLQIHTHAVKTKRPHCAVRLPLACTPPDSRFLFISPHRWSSTPHGRSPHSTSRSPTC